MTTSKFDLPVYFKGTVVHGHGRGGKRLNCPTANLSPETIKQLPHNFPNGVYCGLAKVNDDDLLPMVMSYGDNPYFKDVEKTLEVHILHQYPSDFYSAKLACVVLYHIRPMSSFSTVEELIMAIEGDKTFASIIAVNALPVANNGNSKVSMLNDNDIEYGQEFLDDDKVTSKEDGEKKGIELKGHETNRILKVTDEDGNVKEYKEVVLNPGDFIPNIINQDEEEDEEGEEDEEFSDELDKTSIDEVLRHYVSKENRNKLNSYLDDFKSISALSSLKSEEDSDDLNRGNGEKKSFSFDLKKIISENLVKLTELFD